MTVDKCPICEKELMWASDDKDPHHAGGNSSCPFYHVKMPVRSWQALKTISVKWRTEVLMSALEKGLAN